MAAENSPVQREPMRKEWPLLLLLLADLALMLWALPQMPREVPIHWNIQGEVDDYGPGWVNAVLPAALAWVLYLGTRYLPLIDPKRAAYDKFSGSMRLIRWSLVLLAMAMHVSLVLVSLGHPVAVPFIIRLATALLFVVLGNEMGRLRQNYFVGIKLPWTLASEDNWNRTHRLAGRIWVAGGLIQVAAAFLPGTWGAVVFGAVLVAMIGVPIIYSYRLYRQSQPSA